MFRRRTRPHAGVDCRVESRAATTRHDYLRENFLKVFGKIRQKSLRGHGEATGTSRSIARAFRGVIGPSSRSGGSSYERPVGGLCPVRRGAPLPGLHGSWPPRAEAPAL